MCKTFVQINVHTTGQTSVFFSLINLFWPGGKFFNHTISPRSLNLNISNVFNGYRFGNLLFAASFEIWQVNAIGRG